MRARAFLGVVLVGAASVSACAQILGDFDTNQTNGTGGATSSTSATSGKVSSSAATGGKTTSTGGGTTTSTGGSSSSTTSSSSSSSGTLSSSSSSGSSACTPTSCGTNAYCDSTEGACVACSDFSHLHFGQPFALTVPLPGSGTARFPRMSPADGTMYLAYTEGGSTVLATAVYQSFPSWSAATLLPSPPNPVSATGADCLGPLFLPDGSPIHDLDGSISSGAMLLFDAPLPTADGGILRTVYAYPASSGQPPVALSLPGSSSTTSESEIAVATDSHRLWWLSSSPQGLVTAMPGDNAAVSVPVVLDDGTNGAVDTPWVTPDGTALFFSATYANSSVTHVFFTRLDASTGLTTGQATRIYAMDASDVDGDPALSGNGCTLLFTRNGALWGALRD